MELRHLRYFAMVAAEGSFSRAAEKLHIAQPPLSRQIQLLEEELGTRLLDRRRPLTLTEPGRYFYEQVRQVLTRVDEIKAMTRRIAKGTVTQFSIGFVASTLYEALPELIRRFRITVPQHRRRPARDDHGGHRLRLSRMAGSTSASADCVSTTKASRARSSGANCWSQRCRAVIGFRN